MEKAEQTGKRREAIGKLPQQWAQRITGAEYWDFQEGKSGLVYKDCMQLPLSAGARNFKGAKRLYS